MVCRITLKKRKEKSLSCILLVDEARHPLLRGTVREGEKKGEGGRPFFMKRPNYSFHKCVCTYTVHRMQHRQAHYMLRFVPRHPFPPSSR